MTSILPASENWSTGKKISFRFFATYFLLYVLPLNPILWFRIIPWVGETLFKLPYGITVFPNGSGDTTFNYVQIACYLIVTTVICLFWSLLDRQRMTYNQALYWLLVVLRYYLASMMMLYGFSKINHAQFPFPGPFQLSQPLGQFSPMGLAWAFMGYSTGYNWFTGTAEVLGGILMLFRRTTVLGGIILTAVIGNIVAMNFAFDIPVKLFSLHLLLMTLFILLPDAGPLMNLLVLNRPTTSRDLTPVFTRKPLLLARMAVKILLIGGFLVPRLIGLVNANGKLEADRTNKTPFNSLYQITQLRLNGDSVIADSSRWRQIVIGGSRKRTSLLVRMVNDSVRRYQLEMDTLQRLAIVFQDSTRKYRLTYWQPDSKSLVLSGRLAADSIFVELNRQSDSNYLLVKRGFRWINEYPFNR
jgi:uncharacterized membrane protein YphA (DoxX/SURF4 family)